MRLATIVNQVAAETAKYGFDAAAYEDDLLHALMKGGWSFCGVEEGLFEAMTPNGVQIGAMTPDEIFWCPRGFTAGQQSR